MCLTETALYEYEVNNLQIKNYHLLTYFCRDEIHRGGGVSIYALNSQPSITFTPIDIMKYCSNRILEAVAVRINIEKQNYILLCIYRSPNDTHEVIDAFIENLIEFLDFL